MASVIGRQLPRAVIARVLPEPDLDALLDSLVEEELLDRRARGDGGELRFHHPLIQEVTYEGILRATREQLHREVAEAIEAVLAESHPGYNALLAYHFSLGKDARSAEEYLFRAGDEAARVSASSEALGFFRQASRLFLELHGESGNPHTRATLERKIAFALFYRGELQEAARHFTNAIELLGERTPREGLRTWTALAGTLARVLARLYLGLGARARPPASERDREVLELMFHRARCQTSTDPVGFLLDSFWNVRKLQEIDPRSVELAGGMYAGAIGIFSFGGLSFDVGRRFLALGEPAVRPDDLRDQLLFRFMRFVHHFLAGDWSEEHRLARDLVDRGIQSGMLWEVVNYLGMEAIQRVRTGDFAGAAACREELAKLAELYQNDLARTSALRIASALHAERRELEAAREASRRYYEALADDQIKLLALGTSAHVEVLAGDLEAAAEQLERSDGIERRIGQAPPFYTGGPARSRLHWALARLERAVQSGDRTARRAARRAAVRAGRRALATSRRVAFRHPEVLRLAGSVAWLSGRRRRARRLWSQGLELAGRLGARPEQARLLAERARRDPAAAAGAEEAERLFAELDLEEEARGPGQPS